MACVPDPEISPLGLTIVCPNLIVCEGESDKQFLCKLIEDHNLSAFQVAIAKADKSDKDTGGKSKFKAFLKGLNLVTGNDLLVNIILVTDNDKKPSRSFKELATAIQESGHFKVPSAPLKRAKKRNGPSLYVLMLPWKDKAGTLEHLILEAMFDTYSDNKACLETFHKCIKLAPKNENQKAKIEAQCMISTLSRDDPNCGVSYMWRSKNGFRPLLKHRTFNRLVRFLKKF